MAGWSKITDGSVLDCLKTLHKLRTKDFCPDLELGSKGCAEQDKLRGLFDELLAVFLKEVCGSDLYRPLPPMVGKDQTVDLFRLFLVVREKGGYETVTKNGLWDSVAVESSLGSGIAPAVKLIYVKYLDTLDRWLRRIVKDKESKGSVGDGGSDLAAFMMDLESEFKGFLSEVQKKKDGEYPRIDLEKIDLNFKNLEKFCKDDESLSSVESDGGKKNVGNWEKANGGEGFKNVGSDISKEALCDKKRKRECDSGMLDWIIKVAKNPCDLELGSVPESSKWKCYGSEQLWKQVLLAREGMFSRRTADVTAEQSIWQRKQKMHPSMYDDDTGSERLRCSQRILSARESRALFPSKKSRVRASPESSSGTHSDLDDHFEKQSDPSTADSWFDNFKRKRIPVGPFFQAKVPEWTEESYESDSKWLGTKFWPLKEGETKRILIERERMGKGRQDSCGCQHPGSVDCVRFHIAEKRMRVKPELGSAYHFWSFGKMGEEVALSWTKEDEKKFHAVAKPTSPDHHYWDDLYKAFPSKSRKDLVSYYFNVFLLQRRANQNRSTPCNIDSDDEELVEDETNGLGHEGSILGTPKKVHLNFR